MSYARNAQALQRLLCWCGLHKIERVSYEPEMPPGVGGLIVQDKCVRCGHIDGGIFIRTN